MKNKLKRLLLLFIIGVGGLGASAQALRGTTGLLHIPTGDMEPDKTFKFGGNVLHLTPLRYISSSEVKYTFNYYINITFFPWLEVGYTCTLNHADHGSTYFPSYVWGKYSNQDRSFYGRLRLWKEGWWKSWTPQLVLGADDPGTHESYGGGNISWKDSNGINAGLKRFYLGATKHFDFQNVGNLGVHLTYMLDRPYKKYGYKTGLAYGVNFRVQTAEAAWYNTVLNGFNLMAEYDLRGVNVGTGYSFWNDHINFIAELYDGQYFSGGVQFKVHL
jgi:hypothetical protein